ncbi:hypothetical protein IWX90DRAFT_21864 [Phyllosticta citrichinensis]|uniref:Uncharacterized protein n=1 Tax=Phyllosticta citrichinensis TaxID=1130410 RepID=A0ABR1Y777_9PEZI
MTEVQQAHARDVQEIKNSIVALGLSLQEAPRSSPSAFAETCNQSSSTSGNKSAPSTFAQSGNQSSSTFSTTGNKSVSSTFANSGNRSTPSTFEEAGTNSSSSFGEAGNKSSSTFAEVGKKEPELSLKPAPKRKAIEVIYLSDNDDQPSLVNSRNQDLMYGTARRRTQSRKVMEAASKFALPFAAPTFKNPSTLVGTGATTAPRVPENTAQRLSLMIRPSSVYPVSHIPSSYSLLLLIRIRASPT